MTHCLLLPRLISPLIPVQPRLPLGLPLVMHMTHQRKVTTGEPLCFNINSIFGKAAAFHDMLFYIKPDAVIITETKLNKDINTAEVLPSDLGYTVYMKDRMNVGGGGVALLVKTCYSSIEDTPTDEASISSEIIWVEVELHGHRKLLLSSFYRRPNVNNTSQLEALQLSLETVMSNYQGTHQPLILGGDFNLPDICWDNDCVKGASQGKPIHEFFLSLTFSLTQLVTDCTREDKIWSSLIHVARPRAHRSSQGCQTTKQWFVTVVLPHVAPRRPLERSIFSQRQTRSLCAQRLATSVWSTASYTMPPL